MTFYKCVLLDTTGAPYAIIQRKTNVAFKASPKDGGNFP